MLCVLLLVEVGLRSALFINNRCYHLLTTCHLCKYVLGLDTKVRAAGLLGVSHVVRPGFRACFRHREIYMRSCGCWRSDRPLLLPPQEGHTFTKAYLIRGKNIRSFLFITPTASGDGDEEKCQTSRTETIDWGSYFRQQKYNGKNFQQRNH